VATRQFLIDVSTRSTRSAPGLRAADDAEQARRKALEHKKLERMIAYADTGGCLRATILRYFGDPAVCAPCRSCGNCQPQGIDAYDRESLRKVLSGIARAGERYGRRRIVAMLVGDTGELPPVLTTLSTTGLLRHEPPATLDQWLDAAIAAGLIAVSKDQYRTLSLTAPGRVVMRGGGQELAIAAPLKPTYPRSWRRTLKSRGGSRRRWRLSEE